LRDDGIEPRLEGGGAHGGGELAGRSLRAQLPIEGEDGLAGLQGEAGVEAQGLGRDGALGAALFLGDALGRAVDGGVEEGAEGLRGRAGAPLMKRERTGNGAASWVTAGEGSGFASRSHLRRRAQAVCLQPHSGGNL